MKNGLKLSWGLVIVMIFSLAVAAHAQEKKAEKAKAQKVSGSIGLLDTEKHYMIVVTKEGKLVTVDYTPKTKVTALKPSSAKMSDISLGSSASVEYVKKGDKNQLTKIEYRARKGGE